MSNKKEIIKLFKNEKYFDKKDNESAEKVIKRLAVEKKDNFYEYYKKKK